MYLVTKGNVKKGYLSLSRLMKVERLEKGVKEQLSEMLEGHKVGVGKLVIEKIEVDDSPF